MGHKSKSAERIDLLYFKELKVEEKNEEELNAETRRAQTGRRKEEHGRGWVG
jgi:hypothetical protein